ncbi:hypothetical protein [Spiroplasma poulsonii]|nr:hypothetical protein [Spiroplasma poulsonii]UNF61150.1 hypothetical protein MNU24_04330 [Spiroplasma poulsonii]
MITAIISLPNSVGKLPTSFYLNNPDVTTITLTKPTGKYKRKIDWTK